MEDRYSSEQRGERLIAAGRVFLALLVLLGAAIDPPPGTTGPWLWIVGAGYGTLALFLLVLAVNTRPREGFQWLTHWTDLAFFSGIVVLTRGFESPYFGFYLFALLAATIRFRVRGVVITAVASFLCFVLAGWVATMIGGEPALNRLALRAAHLAYMAVLLVFLAEYLQRINSEVSSLARWSHPMHHDEATLVRSAIQQAAAILRVPRVLMLWCVNDEPWLQIASLSDGGIVLSEEAAKRYEPLVHDSLKATSFLLTGRGPERAIFFSSSKTVKFGDGHSAIHPDLRREHAMEGGVLSVPIKGEMVSGRLFFLDRAHVTPDQMSLAAIVGGLISTDIDHFFLSAGAQQAAISEERLRLARELHDGLLQSLTASTLQLEAARRLLRDRPDDADQRLSEIQSLITADHEDLRAFIRELRPVRSSSDPQFPLTARFAALGSLVKRQWNVDVDWQLDPGHHSLPPNAMKEIYRLMHEAVVNAAKHANARSIRVAMEILPDEIFITVQDDGHGFPFEGQFDLHSLQELKRGPLTLKERIASLKGDLILRSGPSGATLEITVPLRMEEMA